MIILDVEEFSDNMFSYNKQQRWNAMRETVDQQYYRTNLHLLMDELAALNQNDGCEKGLRTSASVH